MMNLDSIRREARREAWYGDSMNPWRKVSRSSTAPPSRGIDLEAGRGADGSSPLSAVQTDPGFQSVPTGSKNEGGHKAEEEQMSKATETGRTSDPDSANTMVERGNIADRASEEGPRQRRHKIQFWRNKTSEEESLHDEVKEKKRPWYKGKLLPHKEPFTVRNQLQRTLFGSWINILLLAAPAGIACNYAKVNGIIIFVVNFIAIVPLAGMLGFATEEIALHVGESMGGLLNATFG
jgi:Ca2+:H+ antiporter